MEIHERKLLISYIQRHTEGKFSEELLSALTDAELVERAQIVHITEAENKRDPDK